MNSRLGIFSLPIVYTEDTGEGLSGHLVPGVAINVRPGLTAWEEANTLVHESIHHILQNMGMGWEEEVEEDFVQRMTPWLQMWLFQNPEVIGYILKLMQ
jgi:hypothetical protein